jgi:hypothetical protein
LLGRTWSESGLIAPSGSAAGLITQQIARSSSQTIAINIDYRPTTVWQHHITLGRNQSTFTMNPLAPSSSTFSDTLFRAGESNGSRTTAGYNMTMQSRLGVLSSTMTLGGDASQGSRSQFSGCLATKAATSYIGCSGGTSATTVTKSLDDKRWGTFGNLQLGLFDQVYLTLGLRGERNPAYGESHKTDWTPTNGLTYTIEVGQLTVKMLGSYGSATRPPNASYRLSLQSVLTGYDLTQYVSQFSAPNLTPEYSRGPQGGLEFYYGNLGSVTINHYQQKITNIIQLVRVDSLPRTRLSDGFRDFAIQQQYQNVANIRQRGWSGTASLNAGPLSVKGTYSWDDSKVTSWYGTVASETNGAFVGVPTHTGNVTVSYGYGGTSMTFVTNYVGSSLQYGCATNPELARLFARIRAYTERVVSPCRRIAPNLGYAKSDLAVSQRLSRWASASLNVMNLGDNYASDVTDQFPSLGRQTLLGVSLRFPRTR